MVAAAPGSGTVSTMTLLGPTSRRREGWFAGSVLRTAAVVTGLFVPPRARFDAMGEV